MMTDLIGEKANSNHNHDSRYYTEDEIDAKLELITVDDIDDICGNVN